MAYCRGRRLFDLGFAAGWPRLPSGRGGGGREGPNGADKSSAPILASIQPDGGGLLILQCVSGAQKQRRLMLPLAAFFRVRS